MAKKKSSKKKTSPKASKSTAKKKVTKPETPAAKELADDEIVAGDVWRAKTDPGKQIRVEAVGDDFVETIFLFPLKRKGQKMKVDKGVLRLNWEKV